MSKLQLQEYTATEIFDALVCVDMQKFLEVMTALGRFSEAAQKRGELISKSKTKKDFDKFIDNMDGAE